MTTYNPFAPRRTPQATPNTPEYDAAPEARSLAGEITSGTTTPASEIAVLWMGEHLALIRRKGSKYFVSRGQQGYTPTAYEAFDTHRVGHHHLPTIVTPYDLTAPCVAHLTTEERKVNDVGQGYYGGPAVPARLIGRAGSAQAAHNVADWIEALRKAETGYAKRVEAARLREKERQEREAAEARAREAARAAEAKLYGAAPKMAAALRDLAGFTARVAGGAAVTRQEAEAAGRVILAALAEAGIRAKVGESVIERLDEVKS